MGQGRATLFGKPADREDSELVPQGTSLPELEFRLYTERGRDQGKHFRVRPASEGDVLTSFSLQLFTAGPGVLCELNKGTLG